MPVSVAQNVNCSDLFDVTMAKKIEYTALGKFLINRGINVPLLVDLLNEYSRNDRAQIVSDPENMEHELMAYFRSLVLMEFSNELIKP